MEKIQTNKFIPPKLSPKHPLSLCTTFHRKLFYVNILNDNTQKKRKQKNVKCKRKRTEFSNLQIKHLEIFNIFKEKENEIFVNQKS